VRIGGRRRHQGGEDEPGDDAERPEAGRRLIHVRQRLLAALGGLLLVSLIVLAAAGTARADGDPASDVLTGQRYFLPQDAGFSNAEQAQLAALLAAAQRSGSPLRVAVIASPTDLGSIAQLWRAPAAYAQFLDQELSLVYHGTLLVVMPQGLGLAGPNAHRAAAGAALRSLGNGAPAGPGLGRLTLQAVQRVSASTGHPLSLGAVSASSSPPPGSGSPLPLVALVLGGVLVVAAWTASLRVRPLGTGGGVPSKSDA
jgi:hypothetical protein